MSKYVVIDLEMCSVTKSQQMNRYKYGMETIQIGAVMLDSNYEVIDQFDTYVSPAFGSVSQFINKLTGISNKDLRGCPSFHEAMNAFIDWLPNEEVRIVSWGMTDRKQIIKEAEQKIYDVQRWESLFVNWINCQELFANRIGSKREYRLEEALNAADIDIRGQAHNGLADAYNTASLFKKLSTETEFKLNSIYEKARMEETEPLTFTFGSLLKNIVVPA